MFFYIFRIQKIIKLNAINYITRWKQSLNFQNKVTGLEVAEKISKSLSKQATVISVDDELKDLSYIIEKDCSS